MSVAAASPSSRSGRAMVCRTSAPSVSTADKIAFVDRLSARESAGHRSVGVRQPEMGAADGGCGRGVRRHHAATRDPLHRARAQPRRPRARRRRGRARDRGVRGGDRNLQPQEHQPVDRRVAGRTYTQVCERAAALGIRVRGYLSTAFGCPYEGDVAPEKGRRRRRAADWPRRLRGRRSATRSGSRIRDRCRGCSTPCSPACRLDQVALHFHDTRGTALANVLAALPYGVSTFDASAGGLGGCPYAPGAAGNLATEDLVYMLDGLGAETGVSLEALTEASAFIADAPRSPAAVAIRAGRRARRKLELKTEN